MVTAIAMEENGEFFYVTGHVDQFAYPLSFGMPLRIFPLEVCGEFYDEETRFMELVKTA